MTDPAPDFEQSVGSGVCLRATDQERAVSVNSNIMNGERRIGGLRSIMVVDDSASQRRMLAMTLRRRGYLVVEATNGLEALRFAAAQSFDLVISDWMMPEMDGLSLCRELRKKKSNAYLYFIFLTSKHEKEEIARGLDAGADDFLLKPANGTELSARIRAGARLVALNREIAHQRNLASDALSKLQAVYEAIDRDLRQAKEFQHSLIPKRDSLFGPARVCLGLEASGHVGGDLVGLFPINESELGLYALDVSGHGVSAALITARLAGLLSAQSADQNLALRREKSGRLVPRDLGDVLHEMNHLLLREIETDHYATLFLAVLNLRSGKMQIAQAGYPPALLLRKEGRVQALGCGGMPIGLIEDAEHRSFGAHIRSGDRLLIVSDGITETMNPDGQFLETSGLSHWPKANAGRVAPDVLPQLFQDIRAYSGKSRLDDDVSGLVLDFQR